MSETYSYELYVELRTKLRPGRKPPITKETWGGMKEYDREGTILWLRQTLKKREDEQAKFAPYQQTHGSAW